MQTPDPWQRTSIGKALTLGQESLPGKSPGVCGQPYTADRVGTCLSLPTTDQASWLSLGKGCFYGLVSLSQSQELLGAM